VTAVLLVAEVSSASLVGLGHDVRGMFRFSRNQYRWGETSNIITDENNQNLEYSESTGTQGAFAQLIWVGPDNTKDPFSTSTPTGVSGDDAVVATTYSFGGTSGVLGPYTNQFKFNNVGSSIIGPDENGYRYYVRVFNGPNPNYASGTNAAVNGVAGITYYYESDVDTFNYSEFGANDTFSFGQGQDRQTLTAVPEPSTLALMGLGAAALIGARRKRRG